MMGFLRVTFPFTVGVLLVGLEHQLKFERDFSPHLCVFLAVILLGPFFPNNWYSEILVVGLVFPLVIITGINCPNTVATRRVLLWLGELSYPLYATHEPLIRLTANAAQTLKVGDHPVIIGILCLGVAIAFAVASALLWDRPVREWLRRV